MVPDAAENHARAAIMETMLWQGVGECNFSANLNIPGPIPLAPVHPPGGLPGTIQGWPSWGMAPVLPPPGPAPVDDHGLALQFATDHPGKF